MKCKHKPHGKRKAAYGSKRAAIWCEKCDAELVNPIPNKKRARNSIKKEIRKQVKEDQEQRLKDMIEREEWYRKFRF